MKLEDAMAAYGKIGKRTVANSLNKIKLKIMQHIENTYAMILVKRFPLKITSVRMWMFITPHQGQVMDNYYETLKR